MLKVNLRKLRAYGDRLDDGVVQMSFTLPVDASPEAKEAAKRLAEAHGFEKVSIASMEPMGKGFTMFVVYGHSKESLDFTKIHVPKIETPEMDYASLKDYMATHLEEPLVVIGACTGADAHTVGIDAIMNMKGYNGHKGLESYHEIQAVNLGAQVGSDEFVAKALELNADALLVSQIVTQKNVHLANLTRLVDMLEAEGVRDKLVLVVGGPRISHELAKELGYDAGFGPNTYAEDVASFVVQEMKRRERR